MLYISQNNGIKKILIEDNINCSEDIEIFLKEISDKNLKYEITFIYINSVPLTIVKALYKLIKNEQVKIITTEKSLWLYFSRLNIKNNLKEKYYINKNFRNSLKAIVIGGSTGSLEKISAIIKSLPYVDITIFIVVHLLKDKKTIMDEILQKFTNYNVYQAKNNLKIETNTIYIAPPNNHMLIKDGFIYLTQDELVNFSKPSISVTFKSLAYEYKSSLLAILVCGYGRDGSSALEDLIKVNAEIIIEDPSECQAKEMVINAINTNNYHKILKIAEINRYLENKLSVSVGFEGEFDKFLDNIFYYYGYDFRNYEKKLLLRRIELLMSQNNYSSFHTFSQDIFNDEKLFSRLLSMFSINVTTFFRNPEIFKEIRKEIKKLNVNRLRVWSAGCSRGDEPYSFAILLDELGILDKSLIYATDFNENILQEAKNGLYSIEEFEKFQENYLKSGGEKEFENYFNINENFIEIKEYLKDKIIFFQHNLATDMSINLFDIILCRNIIIYFDDKLKRKVFEIIDNSLENNGYLILGESESLPEKYKYKTIGNLENKIFKKGSK